MVVGGGIMGSGIAIALIRAGHSVAVIEPEEGVAATLTRRLRDEARRVEVGPAALVTADLEPVTQAAIVIEAAPEDLRLKMRLWEEIGRIAPARAILASNTSSLNIDCLAECVPYPSRAVVTHWFNPAYEVQCVEVAPGSATSAWALDKIVSFLKAARKKPIVVRNDAGFIANRIQFAAIREALLCVEEGAEAEDVDAIVKSSFAPRLAALGPLANADLGGLDTYLAIFETLRAAHGERFAPPRFLVDRVADGRRGVKAGEGIFQYTDASARDLAARRDRLLSRIIAVVDSG